MSLLIIGLLVFFAVHLIPSVPSLRQTLILRLGEKSYLLAFTVLSLLGFGLIIAGKAGATYAHLWTPPSWARWVALPGMVLAFYCLLSKYMPSNFRRLSAHPMLWGVTLWALVHLINNGDVAAFVLFGSFAVFALFDIWSSNRRGATPTSQTYAYTRDAGVLAASLILTGVLIWAHPLLFGVAAWV